MKIYLYSIVFGTVYFDIVSTDALAPCRQVSNVILLTSQQVKG